MRHNPHCTLIRIIGRKEKERGEKGVVEPHPVLV